MRQAEREGKRGKRLTKRVSMASGAALGATVLFAPGAQADTFTVTNLNDSGEGSLRDAVADANAAAGADSVVFQSGLSGTIDLTTGEIPITDELEILGPGPASLTVDAGGASRIFYVNVPDVIDRVTVSGLTLTGGAAPQTGGAIDVDVPGARLTVANSVVTGNASTNGGGGIYLDDGVLRLEGTTLSDNTAPTNKGGGADLDDGTLRVISSTITGNEAGTRGGGIYTDNADGTALTIVRDSTFTGNTAAYDGGGIYLDDGPIEVVNSTFDGNYAGYDGGAVYTDGTNTLALFSGSTFTGNEAARRGGAIYNDDGPNRITDSVFTGNEAADDGGAVNFDRDSTLHTIVRTTMSGNDSGSEGGAVHADDGTVEVLSSTIAGNTAVGGGGGVYASDSLLLTNSTISGNTSDGDGGGVWWGGRYTLDVRSSTIVDNSAAGDGGGIFAYRGYGGLVFQGQLLNTIVAGNSAAGTGPDLDGSFEASFTLIENPAGAEVVEDVEGSNITGQDPELGPLADNGGPTETHAPAPGSPVIDAGISNGLTTDQRGAPRTVDRPEANAEGSDATDIGSLELAAPAPPPPPPPGATASCQGTELKRTDGTEGDDSITGTDLPDAIFGLGGDDLLKGITGADCIDGGAGADNLKGNGGKDLLKGGDGNDKLRGEGGKDKLRGQGGNDKLRGDESRDKLFGGKGKDKLRGGPAKDRYKGGGGADKINAVDNKRDKVNCGGGADEATVDEIDKVNGNCETVVQVEAK